jgi:hypothetical protein
VRRLIAALAARPSASAAFAGAQKYEPLIGQRPGRAAQGGIRRETAESVHFSDPMEAVDWLAEMSRRLEKRIPDREYRIDLFRSRPLRSHARRP